MTADQCDDGDESTHDSADSVLAARSSEGDEMSTPYQPPQGSGHQEWGQPGADPAAQHGSAGVPSAGDAQQPGDPQQYGQQPYGAAAHVSQGQPYGSQGQAYGAQWQQYGDPSQQYAPAQQYGSQGQAYGAQGYGAGSGPHVQQPQGAYGSSPQAAYGAGLQGAHPMQGAPTGTKAPARPG